MIFGMKNLSTVLSPMRRVLMGCVLLLAAATSLWAATPGRFSESVLEVANQDIVTFRGTYDGTSPAARVERAMSRIQELAPRDMLAPIELVPVTIGPLRGLAVRQAGQALFVVTESDLEPGSGETLEQVAEAVKLRLAQALKAMEQQYRWPVLMKGIGLAVLQTLLLGLALWGLWRLADGVLNRLTALRNARAGMARTWAHYGKAVLARLIQFTAPCLPVPGCCLRG